MTNSSTISKWLQQPGSYSEKDRKEIKEVLKAYPYFVPVRYVEAAIRHKKEAFAPGMMTAMLLYRGNWMLFHEFLQTVSGNDFPAFGNAQAGQPSSAGILEDEMVTEEAEYPVEDVREDDEVYVLPETEEDDFYTEIIEVPATPPKNIPPVKPFTKEKPRKEAEPAAAPPAKAPAEELIQPVYTEDYFLHQGIEVPEELPREADEKDEAEKALMVVMSYSEWLMHFKTKTEKEKAEQQDQVALKTMWQKEKLAAALEEENEAIPENVFEMAVNSITREEDLISESLAEILIRQGKYEKAIEMYRKLSLRIPQKKAYFARKIDEIIKDIES